MTYFHPILFIYEVFQRLIHLLFAPRAPKPAHRLSGPRIAVIGAGLSGVAAAAHCVGHGSPVVLFEAGSRKRLGGIWARVNHTSGLQIHSAMYRFHPSVQWHRGFPGRDRILEEITRLWHRYELDGKTKFDTPVHSVRQSEKGMWIVNGEENGLFDGVIAAIGTCGDPMMPTLPQQEVYQGDILHSSQLDGVDVRAKNVVVIGGGASAIEALEYTVGEGATHTCILARVNKILVKTFSRKKYGNP